MAAVYGLALPIHYHELRGSGDAFLTIGIGTSEYFSSGILTEERFRVFIMIRLISKLQQRYESDILENLYGKHVELYLRLSGLHPYQALWSKRLMFCINESVYIFSIFTVVASAIRMWGRDFDIVIENLMGFFIATGLAIGNVVAYLSSELIGQLHSKIWETWQNLDTVREKREFLKLSRVGYFISLGFTAYCSIGSVLACITIVTVSQLLDVIYPLENGARPRPLMLRVEYFIFDQQDHFYITNLHLLISLYVISVMLTGLSGVFTMSVEHTCAFFSIINSRFRGIVDTRQSREGSQQTSLSYIKIEDLKNTVILHNETIKLSHSIERTFNLMVLIAQASTVSALVVLYYYVLHGNAPSFKKFLMLGVILAIYVILMTMNWLGQRIIDSSEAVLDSIYFSDWYLVSPVERRYLLSIMQRSHSVSVLTVGRISILSMESFAKLMKVTNSYFTTLASMGSVNDG